MLHFHQKPELLTKSLLIVALLCLPVAVAAKQYKAAEIYTVNSYGPYGKYRFSILAARGSGLISAFFLWKDGSEQTGNFWEEVDIEIFGQNNAVTWQSNIITGVTPATNMSEGEHDAGTSLGVGYHIFTLEWSPGSVVWSLNGTPVRTVDGGLADDLVSPSQIRFNVWPSESTEWAGPWNDDILPRYMYVDWVEYYPWDDVASEFETDYEWRDDFDTFNTGRWGKADWTFTGNRADFIPQNAYVAGGYLHLLVSSEADINPPSDNDGGYDSGGSDGGYGSGGGGCPWIVIGALSLLFVRRKKT